MNGGSIISLEEYLKMTEEEAYQWFVKNVEQLPDEEPFKCTALKQFVEPYELG